jgi:hypothetical protein
MKRLRLLFFPAILCLVLSLSNCKKSDSKNDLSGNCDALVEDVSKAADAFVADMSEATCNDYYDAIENYYDGCNEIPASLKDEYDQWLESIDCSIFATQ